MNIKRLLLVLLSISLLSNLESRSQIVTSSDSLPSDLYRYLINSSSKHFHDPSIPRFLIKDRSYNFILGIGGYVQSLALYDVKGMEDLGFVISDIPNRHMDAGTDLIKNTDVFTLDMGMSRLFVKLIGVTPRGYINSYIETDFHGSGNTLRLRQAYIDFLGFKVGKGWTMFRAAESPATLDIAGPPSLSDRLLPLLAYTQTFGKGKNMSLSVSLEFPNSTTMLLPFNNKLEILDIKQTSPDIPIAFHWNGNNFYFFAATNFRAMKYPISTSKYKKTISYAFTSTVRYSIPVAPSVSHNLILQGIYTRGMVDCIQDLDGRGMNVIVSSTHDRLSINSGVGFSGGYNYTWGKNALNGVYSLVHIYGDLTKSDNSLYNVGQYGAVNYLRNIFNHGSFGAEVVYGIRTMVDQSTCDDVRFNLLLRYDF